jgi:hypothetical protein
MARLGARMMERRWMFRSRSRVWVEDARIVELG